MAHYPQSIPDYSIQDMAEFDARQYLTEGTSANSSPSPIMLDATYHGDYAPLIMDQFGQQVEQAHYDGYQKPLAGYQYLDMLQPPPVVEFTDLTAPYQEDRRRKRSQTQDKQAISSMHMRRRAQNRASQRAFRERKEKHAQDLQNQLDELDEKYKELQAAYDELGDTNKKLTKELEEVRSKAMSIRAQQSHSFDGSFRQRDFVGTKARHRLENTSGGSAM